jgi:hypothetical protein
MARVTASVRLHELKGRFGGRLRSALLSEADEQLVGGFVIGVEPAAEIGLCG